MLTVGYWAEHKLAGVDAACYTAAGRLADGWKKDEYAQLHRPNTPVQRETIILRRAVRNCPTVHYIAWDMNAPSQADELPLPKQQELATLLHCLSTKLGVRSVAISTPLVWEDTEGQMARHMLDKALSGYRHVGLGLAGRNAPQSQTTPELLQAATIPAGQISGDTAGLPAANMPQPYSLPNSHAPNLLAAPDMLEDEALIRDATPTRGLSLPLLLRWNGEVMAALPLRLALAELGLRPADVHAKLGKSLRIGDRILPLDAHGRTPLGSAKAEPLLPEDVLTAYAPLPEEAQRCAALCRAFSPQPVGERAACLAATLSQLLSDKREELIPMERDAGGRLYELNALQTSLTGRLASLALLLALLYLLPRLRRTWRRATLLALLAGIIAAAWALASRGIYLSLCAWLACWALLALAQWQLSPREQVKEPTLW